MSPFIGKLAIVVVASFQDIVDHGVQVHFKPNNITTYREEIIKMI